MLLRPGNSDQSRGMMLSRRQTAKAAFAFTSTALLGVALPAASAFAGKANDTLNVAFDEALSNADAYFNTNQDGVALAYAVWDQLIEPNPVTFALEPGLATSWKWVNDLTLEFHLRQGVAFQDGQPFTADDVVFTLNFVANPANKVLVRTNVDWIKRAEKVDQTTVLVHLKAPFPAALAYVSRALPIYPHVYYAKVGPEGMGRHPIGTGPYAVRELVPGKSITLVKNPGYWHGSSKGEPVIGKIVVTFPPEKSTQIAELLSGQIDWMWHVPPDQVKNLKRAKGVTVASSETVRVRYLLMDAAGRSGKSPLQNVKVRQAIAYAINRPEYAKTFFGAKAEVPKAPCFPNQFGCYRGAKQYAYDPAKAKALLTEADYPHGFHTTLYATRDPEWAVALAGYLHAVGIDVSVEVEQYAAIHRKAQEGETPLLSGDWNAHAIADASYFLDTFFTGSADDYSGDKELDAWVRDADTNPNQKARAALYKKAIERIMNRMYMLPLSTFEDHYAFSDDLVFTPDKDDIPRFYLAKWK